MKRTCQASWFSTWPWLHYQTHNPDDVVFCHVCVSALKSKRMERSRGDLAFISNGFKDWKDAPISFKNHEASASHKVVMVIPATCSDMGEMLSREHAQEKSENRQCLLRTLSNIRFLSRQGLALRDHGDVTFHLVYILLYCSVYVHEPCIFAVLYLPACLHSALTKVVWLM